MRLQRIDVRDRIGAARGTAVVCIPVYGAHEYAASCLRSVLEHTPPGIGVVVADDATPGEALQSLIDSVASSDRGDRTVYYARQPANVGFVENVNSAFALAAPADIVLLNSDCEVGPGWFDGLRGAAYSDTTVATASALTNHGTILSVPDRNTPVTTLPPGRTTTDVAAAVRDRSGRLRPIIPTAIGHCVYIRRSALDLVGPFDTTFSPGYGEEVDFSQRCILHGLVHVAADDVFVFHHGAGTFGPDGRRQAHEQILSQRYPYYHREVAALGGGTAGTLPRALARARRAIEGISVTIDGRCLGPTITGTQVHVAELTRALALTGRVSLRLIVPPDMNEVFRGSFAALPGLEIVRTDELSPGLDKTMIAHRPFQVFTANDLDLLVALGERIVITHQDLISYRNPGYFQAYPDWEELRHLTRVSLALADRVLFFSKHAADDALRDDLVEPSRAAVALLGVDHRVVRDVSRTARPPFLPEHWEEGDGFLLCLGTNFKHKNRVFALRLLTELRRRHDWNGSLVFAGPHAGGGTSAAEESDYLEAHPDTARRTVDLRAVSEEEKAWLLSSCCGVVYPSLYEGFGLVPFEAAGHGVPCFFAARTALAEILPRDAATIVEWDAAETADAVIAVLQDPTRARELVESVATAGSTLTWDRTAARVLDVYEEALESRNRDLALVLRGANALVPQLARPLGPALDVPDEVGRVLRALERRPQLKRLCFGMVRLVYESAYLLRHGRRPTPV